MKIGLVLEGGAMRGMYTAGVLDIFMENNISVDCISGVSAGALFGVNFLSRQNGRAIRYSKRFNSDKRYMGWYPLIHEGNIVSTDFAYGEVPLKLDKFDDETYKKSDIPLYAAVTNINTGETEYIQIKSVFEQMNTLRASGSMPFMSKPIELNGEYYLDGGITDSIPFEFAQKLGCDKLIVILTRDINYRKNPISPKMAKLFYRKKPKLMQKIIDRHNMYNRKLEALKEMEKNGQVFIVRPSEPIKVKRIEKNPDALQAVYDLGRRDGETCLEALKKYMAD